jgi:hypothetical protein
MDAVYTVEKTRLPLPPYPMGEGPQRDLTLEAQKKFSSEIDALKYAEKIMREEKGYEITISTPDGQKWTNAEIIRRLKSPAA